MVQNGGHQFYFLFFLHICVSRLEVESRVAIPLKQTSIFVLSPAFSFHFSLAVGVPLVLPFCTAVIQDDAKPLRNARNLIMLAPKERKIHIIHTAYQVLLYVL
jgi:hypothetical protein